MGKVVGTILKVVGIAAAVLLTYGTAVAALAGGQLVGIAMAGLTISAGTLQAVALVGVLGGGLLAGSPKTLTTSTEVDQGGARLQLQGNPTQARQVLFGKGATGGNLVYRANTGTKGTDLHLVIALAGHEITSVEGFKFGSNDITFSSNNAVGDYNNFLYKYDHLGTDAQTADAGLVSASAEWTTNHRLRGIAYVYVKAIWDQEVFPSGLLPILVTLKGAAVYDPRLDGTNGGTGSQRYTDQTTWTWSENPALIAATYLLGIKVNGELICGMGVTGTRIDWAAVITAANICEESVNLNGGGTETRYTCNGWINPENSHRDNISAILSACGGGLAFQGGQWRLTAAAAVAAVNSRSGDDTRGGKSFTSKKPTRSLFNGVRGRFSDPASDYSLSEYPSRLNSTYVTADGGQENWLDLDFPFTKSQTMCQRLSKIALERNRMQKTIPLRFNPTALEDTVNDTINFTYAPFGLTNQKMRVADWKLLFTPTESGVLLEVDEMLIEEDDAIYDWDETTDELTYVGNTVAPQVDMLNVTNENWNEVAILRGLPAGIGQDQGDGVYRPSTMGYGEGTAKDADVVTFSNTWDVSNVPVVSWGAGGLAYDSTGTLTGDMVQTFVASGLSASGFTASLRLSGTAAAPVTRTDTGSTETSTDVWELHKSQVAEAWDDNYTFQIDVSTASEFDPFDKIWVQADNTFGFYTNDGTGYVQGGTKTLSSETPSSGTETLTNITKTINVDGLGQIAGYEFKVLIESAPVGASIDNLDSVTYETTGTTPTTVSATPTGVSAIPFKVTGGLDNV